MPKKIIDIIRLAFPLSDEKKKLISSLEEFISKQDLKEVVSLCKQKKCDVELINLNVSPQLMPDRSFPRIIIKTEEEPVKFLTMLNSNIDKKVKDQAFHKFSEFAAEKIPKFIAMNIVGMDEIKKAAALQLFATPLEPIHILLLGDPGTGKTEILRSSSNIHPISSIGLGSGTTGVGLTVTVKGDTVAKGLLPLADKGLCAVDELNLMQEKDRASLYNAMEKGFISYDKGGKHYKFDARVSVIATANPKGDRFVGWTLDTLKKQLPFDSALLTRFHLVFLVRKPDIEQFVEISKKILRNDKQKTTKGDEQFIKDYIEYAEKIDVKIPKHLEKQIVDIIAEIKKNEKKYLIDISPRIVLGFVRLAKASARMHLCENVEQADVDLVKEIVLRGLKVNRNI